MDTNLSEHERHRRLLPEMLHIITVSLQNNFLTMNRFKLLHFLTSYSAAARTLRFLTHRKTPWLLDYTRRGNCVYVNSLGFFFLKPNYSFKPLLPPEPTFRILCGNAETRSDRTWGMKPRQSVQGRSTLAQRKDCTRRSVS